MLLGPLLNAAYLLAAAVAAPWWMRKARSGWGERFGKITPIPKTPTSPPRLLIHAVSVGEVNLIRPLIDALLEHPQAVQPIVSATTDTGIERARKLYSDRCPVVRYPLDATWAVRRFLDAVQPDAVALTELELWPNFATACAKRGIPLAVINGRLSARSFKRYRLARFFLRRYFASLAFVAAQNDDYAQRFIAMGVDPLRCVVTDSMKWDAAPHTPDPALDAAAEALAQNMGIDRTRRLVVAGSTAPGEHELILRALWAVAPSAQLLCAPRKPEWFDDAARALPGCVRRSLTRDAAHNNPASQPAPNAGLFLLDTIGELRAAYQLADLIVVGRSFGNLHGSDPMEPAALRKPIIIGPRIGDFQDPVAALLADDAIVQTTDEELPAAFKALLNDPDCCAALAANAARCVENRRGSTARHLDLLLALLRKPSP